MWAYSSGLPTTTVTRARLSTVSRSRFPRYGYGRRRAPTMTQQRASSRWGSSPSWPPRSSQLCGPCPPGSSDIPRGTCIRADTREEGRGARGWGQGARVCRHRAIEQAPAWWCDGVCSVRPLRLARAGVLPRVQESTGEEEHHSSSSGLTRLIGTLTCPWLHYGAEGLDSVFESLRLTLEAWLMNFWNRLSRRFINKTTITPIYKSKECKGIESTVEASTQTCPRKA